MAVPTKEELENALQVVEGFEDALKAGPAALAEFSKSYTIIKNAASSAREEISRLEARARVADEEEKERLTAKIERAQAYQSFITDNNTRVQEALQDQAKAYSDTLGRLQEEGEAFYKAGLERQANAAQAGVSTAQKAAAAAAQTTAQAVETQAKFFGTVFQNFGEFAAARAIKSLIGVGPAVSDIASRTKVLGSEVDAANAAFGKIGLANPMLKELQILALDGGAATNRLGVSFEKFGGLVSGTGLSVKDTNDALMALIKNSPEFRRLMESNLAGDREAALALVNYGASLKQIGVSNEKFTEQIDFLTKVKKDDIATSLETTLAHTKMAKQLGLDSATIFEGFSQSQEMIARFGADGTEVFQDLQVLSAKTNISMGSLNQTVGKLDDFRGATETAQRLNAVLADTGVRLSPEKLFQMDPAEKIRYLGEKLQESGIFADGAGKEMRFLADGLREITGVPVTDLRRMADPEALAASREQLDLTRDSAEQLGVQIRDSLTVPELTAVPTQQLFQGAAQLTADTRAAADKTRLAFEAAAVDAREEAGEKGGTLAFVAGAQMAERLSAQFSPTKILEKLSDVPGLNLFTPLGGAFIAPGAAAVAAAGTAGGTGPTTPVPTSIVEDKTNIQQVIDFQAMNEELRLINNALKDSGAATQKLVDQNAAGLKIEGTLNTKTGGLTGKASIGR